MKSSQLLSAYFVFTVLILKLGVCRIKKIANAIGPTVLDLRVGTPIEQLTHKYINETLKHNGVLKEK